MLDINEVKNTIIELENGKTSFDSCIKLASLYQILDHYNKKEKLPPPIEVTQKQSTKDVQSEYLDILPEYRHYCDIKGRYQMGELPQQPVLNCLSNVCLEIQEFILTLYSSTDMEDERILISNALKTTLERVRN